MLRLPVPEAAPAAESAAVSPAVGARDGRVRLLPGRYRRPRSARLRA
jgi:hypothetical protein